MLAPALLFLLLLLFYQSHVMIRCLKRHLPPDGNSPDFHFILNFQQTGFTLRWEAGCCCVSCSISVIRPVSLHGRGSPLAPPPHLIILTCVSPRPLFTPAGPHSLVSSVWFESTSTKAPTFTSVVHLILGGRASIFQPSWFLFYTTLFFLGPNLLMS